MSTSSTWQWVLSCPPLVSRIHFCFPSLTPSSLPHTQWRRHEPHPHSIHNPSKCNKAHCTHPSKTPGYWGSSCCVLYLGLHSAPSVSALSSEALSCNPGSTTNEDLICKMKNGAKYLHPHSRGADRDYQSLWCRNHLEQGNTISPINTDTSVRFLY